MYATKFQKVNAFSSKKITIQESALNLNKAIYVEGFCYLLPKNTEKNPFTQMLS
jgi:hypothetical protein